MIESAAARPDRRNRRAAAEEYAFGYITEFWNRNCSSVQVSGVAICTTPGVVDEHVQPPNCSTAASTTLPPADFVADVLARVASAQPGRCAR